MQRSWGASPAAAAALRKNQHSATVNAVDGFVELIVTRAAVHLTLTLVSKVIGMYTHPLGTT